eukprot:scaffold7070_cov125-Isochrysis_galbana.AAC.5
MPRLPSALGLGRAKRTGGLEWTLNPPMRSDSPNFPNPPSRRAFAAGVGVVRVCVACMVQLELVEPSVNGRVGEDSITNSRGHHPELNPAKKSKAVRVLVEPRSSTTSAGEDPPNTTSYAVESISGKLKKTKLRERVEANDGAPTTPAGAGGGGYGRGRKLEASPR